MFGDPTVGYEPKLVGDALNPYLIPTAAPNLGDRIKVWVDLDAPDSQGETGEYFNGKITKVCGDDKYEVSWDEKPGWEPWTEQERSEVLDLTREKWAPLPGVVTQGRAKRRAKPSGQLFPPLYANTGGGASRPKSGSARGRAMDPMQASRPGGPVLRVRGARTSAQWTLVKASPPCGEAPLASVRGARRIALTTPTRKRSIEQRATMDRGALGPWQVH